MTVLEAKFENMRFDESILKALKCLKGTFHTYSDEEGILYEEDCLQDWHWDCGVSKVCIIFNSFVFKKAFAGTVTEVDWETGEMLDEPVFDNYTVDMCQLEYDVYCKAVEHGVADFFSEIIKLDSNIYIQDRIFETLDDYIDNPDNESIPKVTKEIKEKFEHLYLCIGGNALSLLLQSHSEEKVLQLQDFIEEFDINDLHQGNMGFDEDYNFKFFDYCGFCSYTSERIYKNKS